MTEPTELSKLRHLYQNMVNGAVRDTASAKRIAEGLLAPTIEALERGTPPAVAGEPVAWRYRPSAVWDDYVLTDDTGKAARARANGLHVEALCLSTPQPTQAQAETPCRKNPFYHGPRNCSRGTVGCCEDHGVNTHPQAGAAL